MTLYHKTPFYRTNETLKDDKFTVKLSKDGSERELLEKCKRIIEQPKDSTAIKQLAFIGAKVLLDEKTEYIITTLFKNSKKNKRLGIPDYD
jgi:hypothetical protein